MLFSKTLLVAALASVGVADWLIEESSFTFAVPSSLTNDADKASKWIEAVASKYSAAISSYDAKLTADPKFSSVSSFIEAYIATRTDAPKSVLTASTTTTTYITEPAWYRALPTDVLQYYSSIESDGAAIASSVVSEGAAPKPTPMAKYVGGVLAAAAAGAAVLV